MARGGARYPWSKNADRRDVARGSWTGAQPPHARCRTIAKPGNFQTVKFFQTGEDPRGRRRRRVDIRLEQYTSFPRSAWMRRCLLALALSSCVPRATEAPTTLVSRHWAARQLHENSGCSAGPRPSSPPLSAPAERHSSLTVPLTTSRSRLEIALPISRHGLIAVLAQLGLDANLIVDFIFDPHGAFIAAGALAGRNK